MNLIIKKSKLGFWVAMLPRTDWGAKGGGHFIWQTAPSREELVARLEANQWL